MQTPISHTKILSFRTLCNWLSGESLFVMLSMGQCTWCPSRFVVIFRWRLVTFMMAPIVTICCGALVDPTVSVQHLISPSFNYFQCTKPQATRSVDNVERIIKRSKFLKRYTHVQHQQTGPLGYYSGSSELPPFSAVISAIDTNERIYSRWNISIQGR
jgi:hypothetical protein